MAPVFFVIYLLPRFFPLFFAIPPQAEGNFRFIGAPWTVPVLWLLFIASEITDMLDGMIARKRGEVS
ncbi:MAG: CDP-alcohol phosphatidyltransferase family protein, partial [Treponema sp.]|nr:CDP-alcohol phosphatidyltransferase family protein [Treponema sp.]